MHERPAKEMTDVEIAAETLDLENKWDIFHRGFDGHGGSPGEWMFERMDELEAERKRRLDQQKPE